MKQREKNLDSISKFKMLDKEKQFVNNFIFSKKLGQNFILNTKTQERIYLTIRSFILHGSKVIEIGPGVGAITKFIENDFKVIAIEIDKKIVNYLESLNLKNLTVINEDCLKIDMNKLISNDDLLFSNTPYSITTVIVHKFIDTWNFNQAVLLMQTEVADRIMAKTGSKYYSAFSVFCQTFLEVKKLFSLNSKEFYPEPKVESTLLYLLKKEIIISDINDYWKFIQQCFKMRRKKIINNLKTFCSKEKVNYLVNKFNLENKRAQELSSIEFLEIYKNYEQ